mmetsp:Transcript_20652/g.51302  ORF Transcript_20652/g.51302 Transcript_20652/m.51302 type:complete len:213 (+) Transcript_20652:75-713(+)
MDLYHVVGSINGTVSTLSSRISYPILKRIWDPLFVSTIVFVNSPTFRRKDASSNGGCIFFRPKNPRSPPRLADEQSDSVRASSWKVARSSLRSPSSSCKISKRPSSSSCASSMVCVIWGFLHEAGRLEPLCFFKICKTLTSFGADESESSLRGRFVSRGFSCPVASCFRGGEDPVVPLAPPTTPMRRSATSSAFSMVLSTGGSHIDTPVSML